VRTHLSLQGTGSIGLIQIRHVMYSHEVTWARRPHSECARTQIGLKSVAMCTNSGQIMLSSLSETVSSVMDRIFENFALLKLYILYILLYLIFHVLRLPFKA
jgi:hypothetical protein